jgi:mono/diheme cytochrome c family protein
MIAGREVINIACAHCHTVDGYNGVRLLVKGWSARFIDSQLQHLDQLKGFMPPFPGNPTERTALAKWLASLNPGGVPADVPENEPEVKVATTQPTGEGVFAAHCGNCHTLDGRNALRPKVAAWSRSKAYSNIGKLETMRGYMPPFGGTDAEREVLASWVAQLNSNATAPVGGGR